MATVRDLAADPRLAADRGASLGQEPALSTLATLHGGRERLGAPLHAAAALHARPAVVEEAAVGAAAAVRIPGGPGVHNGSKKVRPLWTPREVPLHRVAVDNLAHALVGAALGRAVADPKVPRAALIGAVAANAPDWTELFIGLPGDRSTFLILHRGITHSLVAALVETIGLTLVVGLGARLWERRRGGTPPPWGWLAACIGATVLSHLYMDWQGSYGLRPFLPWSGTWYYADWVAIVDPFFWVLPLIALTWGEERHWIPLAAAVAVLGLITRIMIWGVREDAVASWVVVAYVVLCGAAAVGWVRYWGGPVARRRVAAFGLLGLAVYASAQGIASHWEKSRVARAAVLRFGPDARWATLTEYGWPFTWEAIYASRDSVAGDDWQMPRHLDVPIVQRALRDTREGRAIAQFARFLVAEVDSTGTDDVTVYLRDARYARTGRDGWAVTRVTLNRSR